MKIINFNVLYIIIIYQQLYVASTFMMQKYKKYFK